MLLMLIPCAEGWTELAFPVLGPCTEASAGWRRIFATSCAIASLSSSPKRSWVSTCSWDPSESDMTDEWWNTLLVLWRCQRKKVATPQWTLHIQILQQLRLASCYDTYKRTSTNAQSAHAHAPLRRAHPHGTPTLTVRATSLIFLC